MSLFSALKKAKGLGSAHNGTQHFIRQRASAVILIPVVLYFLYSIIVAVGAHDLSAIHHYLANPFNTALLLTFMLIGYYHGALGLQVVIEDYVHDEKLKWLSLIAINGVCFIGALTAFVAILRLALV